jgi:hypothetical protein
MLLLETTYRVNLIFRYNRFRRFYRFDKFVKNFSDAGAFHS